MGIEPVFWTGVVESRDDPLKIGRVRVRLAGLHSEKFVEDDVTGEGIPVNNLPWASAGMPITSASMNGIGDTPIGPVEGTWVCGISRDGRTFQNLVYLWTLPGIPKNAPNLEAGFNDNKNTRAVGTRPKRIDDKAEHYPKTDYVGESDVNRLARNANIDKTIIKKKRDTEDKNVPQANGGTWSEKTTPYAAQYPFNRVNESESGHITEVDDTPSAERTHEYHRSGTSKEVHPDGTEVHRVVSDRYEIVYGSDFVHVKGDASITVDGNAKIYVKGNVDEQVGGNVIRNIAGTYTVNSSGNMKFTAPRVDIN